MTSALSVSSPLAFRPHASRLAEITTGDDGLSTFLSMRSRLFGIAYRMLGSAAEAEDVVQDVWLRWQTTDRSVVRDSAAFLSTTAARLAINVRQSARARRETYLAPTQPEPADTKGDPTAAAERGQALASGVRMLLERLTPTERAAYILREAFDYAYREIANSLSLEEANARQVVTRARQHLTDPSTGSWSSRAKPRDDGRKMSANSTEQGRLSEALIAAAQNGDVASLEETLCSGCRDMSTRQPLSTASSLDTFSPCSADIQSVEQHGYGERSRLASRTSRGRQRTPRADRRGDEPVDEAVSRRAADRACGYHVIEHVTDARGGTPVPLLRMGKRLDGVSSDV